EGGVVASPDVRNPGETVMPSRILVLVALAVLLTPAFKAIRQGDRRRLLFGLCLAAVVAAATASGRLSSVVTVPRFLFALFAVMAPLVGAAFTPSPSGGSRRWWRAGALASLILIHFASILVARPNLAINDREVTASLDPLQKYLEKQNLSRVYANYWTAYRLSFESDERIIATPLSGAEAVRYEPYRLRVDRALDPAVILLNERDRCFQEYLDEKGFAYRRARVDSFGVFTELAPGALVSLRAGLGLPLPSIAYRAGWHLDRQLSSMAPGHSLSVPVRVVNARPLPLPHLRPFELPLVVSVAGESNRL